MSGKNLLCFFPDVHNPFPFEDIVNLGGKQVMFMGRIAGSHCGMSQAVSQLKGALPG